MNTALVLINSASRSGERQRDEALRLLAAEGVSLIVAPPTPAEDIPALIERHRKEIDRVIVGGGDGSLQAVAPALAWQSLRLGILPLGTANDLARTLDIPTRLEDACRLLASDSERRIDLGEVNGHYFFNVANIGLGVEVRR